MTRYLTLLTLLLPLNAALAQEGEGQNADSQAVKQLLPGDDEGGGGGGGTTYYIDLGVKTVSVANSTTLFMTASIFTNYSASTIFTCTWKVNGISQSFTATKSQLASGVYLNVGSHGLVQPNLYHLQLTVAKGSVTTGIDDLPYSFYFIYLPPTGLTVTSYPSGAVSPNNTTASFTFSNAAGSNYYKWRLDNGAWSAATAVGTPLNLSGLSYGSHTVSLIGGWLSSDVANNWMSIPVNYSWTISSPTITVTSPNGGEKWGKGLTKTITWTSNYSGGNVKLLVEYGFDYFYEIISSTPNSGSYSWVIPSSLADRSDYVLNIEGVGFPASDVGNASFTIQTDQLSLTTPNSGNFRKGGTLPIIWSTNVTGNVKIELYNGSAYTTLATVSAASGSWTWNIPSNQATGSAYKIRLSALDHPGLTFTSSSTFEIADPYVQIGAPVFWNKGLTYTISWGDNIDENVKIELLKGGTVSRTISSSEPSDGSFSYAIPYDVPDATDYALRVTSVTNGALTSTGPVFAIRQAYRPTDPSPGETLITGQGTVAKWSSDLTDPVNIYLLKNGVQVQTLGTNVSNTLCTPPDELCRILSWNTAGLADGADYQIKIARASNADVYGIGSSFSVITPVITLGTIQSPNGWARNKTYNVQWTDNFSESVVIELKHSDGTAVVSEVTPSDGSFDIPVPANAAPGSYHIEIRRNTASNQALVSSQPIRIRDVVITSLSGTTAVYSGQALVLQWETALTGPLEIWISNELENPRVSYEGSDTGRSRGYATQSLLPCEGDCELPGSGGGQPLIVRKLIAVALSASTGQYTWYVPEDWAPGQYWFELKPESPAVPEYSQTVDFQFPPISLATPDNGERWRVGRSFTIRWVNNVGGNCTVELYKGLAMVQQWTATDSVVWAIPSNFQTGTDYKIKITSNNSPQFDDWSDLDFSILAPYVQMLSPNGTFYKNQQVELRWDHNLDTDVNLYLKKANDANINQLIGTYPSTQTSVTWLVPSALDDGNQYYIYAVNSVDNVQSNGPRFSVSTSRIDLLTPSLGNLYNPGHRLSIQWTTNTTDSIKLELYREGVRVQDIASNLPWNGNATVPQWEPDLAEEEWFLPLYVWTVPSGLLNSDVYTIRITKRGSISSQDESPAFSIAERMNSVHSQTFLKEGVTDGSIPSLQDHEIMQTTAYSNGLGKLLQTINWKATPSKQDILTVNEYDILGLPARSFLPFTKAHNSGLFNQTGIQDVLAFYNNPPANVPQSAYPYSEQKKEKSPRLTVLEQSAPGESWNLASGHTVKTKQRTNNTNEVRYWDPVTLAGTTFYTAGQISVSEVTDENNVSSWTYTDMEGHTILKKSMKGSDEVLTYYVYDDYDNLKYIIPPEACKAMRTQGWTLTQTIKDKWVTEFWYDGFQRLVEKKIPEAAAIYTVYDRMGRVALTQDGLLRAQNKWMFTKYDRLGRAILTGVYTDATRTTRAAMQAYLDAGGTLYEERSSANYASQHGYTNQALPDVSQCEVWTVTYYDDYDFNYDTAADSVYRSDGDFSGAGFYRLQGKVTGTKTLIPGGISTTLSQNVFAQNGTYTQNPSGQTSVFYAGDEVTLDPDFQTYDGQEVVVGPQSVPGGSVQSVTRNVAWLTSVSFYDKYGRVIQTQSNNSLGGTDVSNTEYDFPGKVLKTKTVHTTPNQTVTVRKRFEYDHAGRLIATYQQNNSDSEIMLAKNSYNELGTLIEKKLHSTNGGSSVLQTVNYAYNIRGWLTKVNDPTSLGSDLFAMELKYESVDASITGTAQYNGNISQQIWATSASGKHAYGYSYDEMNQLLSAEYEKYVSGWNTDQGKYNESALYDLNGNIKTLSRYAGSMVDNLTFTLEGNRLLGSDDALANTAMALDFEDRGSTYSTSNTEYIYDANGNLIEDKNKKIKVRYNFMNLPVCVVFNNSGDSINWVYASSGMKLRKIVFDDGAVIKTLDYVSGFDYTNGTLDFFYCEQGRVKKLADGSLRHEYNLTDHLGNSRVFFTDANNDGTPEVIQESHFYAFGLRIEGLGVQNDNKYLYNGKELTDDFGLNWYEYGWRMYDAEIGRWHQVDPMDEFMSPYCFVGNDPINLIDPDGAQTGGELVPTGPGIIDGHVIDVMFELVEPSRELTPSDDFFGYHIRNAMWHRSSDEVFDGLKKSLKVAEFVANTVVGFAGGEALIVLSMGGRAANAVQTAKAASTAAEATNEVVQVANNAVAVTKNVNTILGRNAIIRGKRILTDLPGGKATAKGVFRHLSKNQKVKDLPLQNGGIRRAAENGIQIRFNPNGSTRIDLPNRIYEGFKGIETIHFGL